MSGWVAILRVEPEKSSETDQDSNCVISSIPGSAVESSFSHAPSIELDMPSDQHDFILQSEFDTSSSSSMQSSSSSSPIVLASESNISEISIENAEEDPEEWNEAADQWNDPSKDPTDVLSFDQRTMLPDLLKQARTWAVNTEIPFLQNAELVSLHDATAEQKLIVLEKDKQEEDKQAEEVKKERVEHSMNSQVHGLEQLSFAPVSDLLQALGDSGAPFTLVQRDYSSSDLLAADINDAFCILDQETFSGGLVETPLKHSFGLPPRLSADDRWEVIFWDSSLRGLDRLGSVYRRKVVAIVYELAQGRFPPTPAMLIQKSRRVKQVRNLLFQTPLKGVGDTQLESWHLIWQVDWDYSPRKRCVCEVLRVWDVVPLSELRAVSLTVVSRWLASAERYAAFLCQAVVDMGGNTQELFPRIVKKHLNPTTFVWEDENTDTHTTALSSSSKLTKPLTNGHINGKSSEAEMPLDAYILDKFVSSSSTLLQEIIDGNANDHFRLFRLSPREHQLLKAANGQSVLVSGRSGTGKTTCGLLRLATMAASFNKMFRAGEGEKPKLKADESEKKTKNVETKSNNTTATATTTTTATATSTNKSDNTRSSKFLSMFVAVSPRLCQEAKHFYTKVCESNTELKGENMLDTESMPKFFTLSQLLLFIDSSLKNPFFSTSTTNSSSRNHYEKKTNAGEEDDDDEEEDEEDGRGWRGEGKAEGEKYELPIDELCRSVMVGRWLPPSSDDMLNMRETSGESLLLSSFLEGKKQARATSGGHINYDRFVFTLFPLLRSQVPMEFRPLPHPGVVWRHIQSFIKGSLQSIATGRLTLDQYLSLGMKRGRLDIKAKHAIYHLFLAYETYKQMNHMFDLQDFVCHVFRQLSAELQSRTYEGPQVSFMVVDEAQDLTQAQIAIVLLVSGGHVFLCADSCQTIAQDVDFRFCDVRSLIFHQQRGEMGLVSSPFQGKKSDSSSNNKPPLPMQLIHNFRTHAAILALSSTCVDLLEKLFPQSIDIMERDQGACQGPKPLLLTLPMSEVALAFEEGASDVTTDFGAQQAVIVRSESVKRTLPKTFQEGLVLTPEQAKGLEFDTVILYNLFENSLCSVEVWRAVVSHLNLDPAVVKRLRRVAFDPLLHDALCAELKVLYVALTRARKHLVIIDDSWSTNPLLQAWVSLDLVRVSKKSAEMLTVLAGGRTQDKGVEQWIQHGEKFMEEGKYELGAQCFGKGNKPDLRDRCAAYALAVQAAQSLAQAEQVDDSNNSNNILDKKKLSSAAMRKQLRSNGYSAYKEAGLLLLRLGRLTEACGCLWSAKDWMSVAHICALLQEWNLCARAWEVCSRPLYTASALINAKEYLGAAAIIAKYSISELLNFLMIHREVILTLYGHTKSIIAQIDKFLSRAGAYYAMKQDWQGVRDCIAQFSDPNVGGAAFLVEHRLWPLLDEYAKGGDGVERMGRILEKENKYMEAALCFHRAIQYESCLRCLLLSHTVISLTHKSTSISDLCFAHFSSFSHLIANPFASSSSSYYPPSSSSFQLSISEKKIRTNIEALLSSALLSSSISSLAHAKGILIWYTVRSQLPNTLESYTQCFEHLTNAVDIFHAHKDNAREMSCLEILWCALLTRNFVLTSQHRPQLAQWNESIELDCRIVAIGERLCSLYSETLENFWPTSERGERGGAAGGLSLEKWKDPKVIHSCDQFPREALAHFGLEASESRFTRPIPLKKKQKEQKQSNNNNNNTKPKPVDDFQYEGDIFFFSLTNFFASRMLTQHDQKFFKRHFHIPSSSSSSSFSKEKKVYVITKLKQLFRSLISEYLRRMEIVIQHMLSLRAPAQEHLSSSFSSSSGFPCMLTRQLLSHSYLSHHISKFYVLLNEQQRNFAMSFSLLLFQAATANLTQRLMFFSPSSLLTTSSSSSKTKEMTVSDLPLSAFTRRYLVSIADTVWQSTLVSQTQVHMDFVWDLFVVLASIGRLQRWQDFMFMRFRGVSQVETLVSILNADPLAQTRALHSLLYPQFQKCTNMPSDVVFIIANYCISPANRMKDSEQVLKTLANDCYTFSSSTLSLATWLAWTCHSDVALAGLCVVHLSRFATGCSYGGLSDIPWPQIEPTACCLYYMKSPDNVFLPTNGRRRAPTSWTTAVIPSLSWGPTTTREICSRAHISDSQQEDPPVDLLFARFRH